MHRVQKLLSALVALVCLPAFAQQPQHLFFRVTLGPQFSAPVSGRVLIFLSAGSGAKSIDENPFRPTAVYVAAKEVSGLKSGESVDVDTDSVAYPSGFSSLQPGDYQAQAVLDQNHSYSYDGRGSGDLISEVLPLPSFKPGFSAIPVLTLTTAVQEGPAGNYSAAFNQAAHEEDFESAALSGFYGRTV